MASTYTPIATTTLGSSAASYTFSSIPSTYTDLVIVSSATITAPTSASWFMRFNGDTASNYSDTYMYGSGSSAGTLRDSSITGIRFAAGANGSADQSTSITNIQNYSNSTTYKTILSRYSNAAADVSAYVGMWRSTSAITSITLYLASTANFATGSTFTLYAIQAA